MRPRNALPLLGFAQILCLLVHCAGSSPASMLPPADAGAEAGPGAFDDAGRAPDSEVGDGAPEASPASCTLPPSGLATDDTCTVCLQTSCCEAIAACFMDPACVGIDSCLSACFAGVAEDGGLAGCESRCLPDASGATADAALAELACFAGVCSVACPGPPTCGTPSGTYAQTCNDCQLVGATLTCNCVDQAGDMETSSLTLCSCAQPPVVANTDGVLGCPAPDAGTED